MAEEYANENWEHYEEGQNDGEALKQAYLAGLKAGKDMNVSTKWHDLRKNPCDEPQSPYFGSPESGAVKIAVLTDKKEIVYYYYDTNVWTDLNRYEIKRPRAWCEIPKFEEVMK